MTVHVGVKHYENVRRSYEQQRDNVVISKGRRERGEEKLKASRAHYAMVHKSDEISLPYPESVAPYRPMNRSIKHTFGSVKASFMPLT